MCPTDNYFGKNVCGKKKPKLSVKVKENKDLYLDTNYLKNNKVNPIAKL